MLRYYSRRGIALQAQSNAMIDSNAVAVGSAHTSPRCAAVHINRTVAR
jgi:hypothetical protein